MPLLSQTAINEIFAPALSEHYEEASKDVGVPGKEQISSGEGMGKTAPRCSHRPPAYSSGMVWVPGVRPRHTLLPARGAAVTPPWRTGALDRSEKPP